MIPLLAMNTDDSLPTDLASAHAVIIAQRQALSAAQARGHLVLEGRNAERPLRSIRFRNIGAPYRRSDVAARPDAIKEVLQVGLQVRLISVRGHAVDTGRAILAG